MVTDYYLQNRTFDKDRDIECGGKMVVGSDVLPQDRYLYDDDYYSSLTTTETKKSQSSGSVTVNAGKTLILEAKDSIELKAGFHAKSGSRFLAKVDGTNPNSRSAVNGNVECGRILKSRIGLNRIYSVSGNEKSVTWTLKGYQTNFITTSIEFELPVNLKKGQYSLYAENEDCPIASIVISKEQSTQKINEPWIESETIDDFSFEIIPNPANKLVTISSELPFKKIKVLDISGIIVYEDLFDVETKNVILDLTQYKAGTYFVQLNNSNESIGTKKLVVQHY